MAIHTSRRNSLGSAAEANETIASLMEATEWAKTPVGPRSTWSQSLRTSLSIMIDSGFPMVVMWGPELVLFYNAGYAPILGEKHPWAMGRPMRDVWPEIWETIGPMLQGVMRGGVATYNEDLLLPLFRSGYLEECYFTFSYSPIADRDRVCGVFCAVAETSRKVIAERRLRTLHELEAQAIRAMEVDQACLVAAQVLAHNPLDVPFSRIYLFEEGDRLRLCESSGPPPSEREGWPIEEAAQTLTARVVPSTIESTSTLVQSAPVTSALVLPIAAAGQSKALGAIVLGLSPFSAVDEEYRRFLELTAGQIAAAIQRAQAYQDAKNRAEALAELDRAKTAFFNNISHEFRTPLTLLLGPIEHVLRSAAELDPKTAEELQMARRNAYRLLKLVNQLLEFSRIEAQRADASYEGTDVARLTADIASTFRSAVEQAGLTLDIDAAAPVMVYVDRAMWERIVLNLLSNAIKSTFSGGIAVRVWGDDERAFLRVSDTGVGIAQEELPTIFERFKRVRGAKSRTDEGTGIGLALVHELVRLHGGTVHVTSALGRGTSFTIEIPAGKAHVRAEDTVANANASFSAERVAQYLQEVAGWLQGGREAAAGSAHAETIVVVDDNPDLRAYLHRVLSARWNVILAADGGEALDCIASRKPDLVISDIMMPKCDGLHLLERLRSDPNTKRLPVILLSARAGEEASIQGLQEGADDYIVKPFSEENLLARVEAALKAAKLREEAIAIAERARDVAVENEQILRMLADAIPQIVCTAAPNGVIDYFNRRWFEFTGLTPEQSLRKGGWRDAIHPADRAALERRMREAVSHGDDFALEFRVRSATNEYRWFLARAVALRGDDGRVVRYFSTATDIDEQKRIEARETFLSRVSDELASTLDVRAILQKITELCIPTFCDWCQVSSLSADDELIVEAVSHIEPELSERLQSLVGRSVVDARSIAPGSPQVLRGAQSSVLDHARTLRAVQENVPEAEDRATYEAAGLGTALIVPLVARGRVRGTLHLVNIDPSSRRPEITLEIAEELARRAAVAIDNSRLYEREHRVASALQRAMLPANLPSHARVELSYAYRPAERESRVGGDWYDAFLVSENRVAISIGDVGGHGLEAAVAMNEARQAIRLSALEGMTPAQTLRRTNAALMLREDPPIITALFGVVDLERSSFRYSCAGHPPPAIAPLAGGAHYIEGGGIPLGVDVDAPFPTLESPLEPYATLLLYTDGLIEYDRNIERESARLLAALSARVQDSTTDGAGALVRNLLDNRQLDDIAVLSATILPARPAPVDLRLPAAPTSAAIARRLAMRFARVAKLPPQRTFDLTIAVGEAVANAVEHAYRGTTGDFVLRLAMRQDTILGEVEDLGTWRSAKPDADRGRGLAILEATTSRLELNRSSHGTTVSFAV